MVPKALANSLQTKTSYWPMQAVRDAPNAQIALFFSHAIWQLARPQSQVAHE